MLNIVSSDGTRIAYDVYGGGGTPLILVEGAFCGRHFGPTSKLAERLGTDLTVYHYDRRARGDSGASTDYRTAREIEDIAAMIEIAGGRAALCGFSSGACLAIEAAAAGLPVTQLMTYEPPYMVGPKARAVPRDFVTEMQQLVAEGRNGEAVRYFMVRLIGMPALFWPMIRLSKMYRTLAAQAPSLPFDMAAVNGFVPPVERMTAIKVPTLAMYGSKTMPVLRDSTELCARTIPGAELRVLSGQTHEVKAEAIAPEILAFLGVRQVAAA